MKKIVILFILLTSVMMANAKSLVLTLSNGTLVYYRLGGDTNPVMRFVDGKVVVTADTYEFSGIKNFYISDTDDPTAINTVETNKEVSFYGNTFVIKDDASNVKVYSLNGTEVEASVIKGNGSTSVNIGSLPKGTYMIQVGTTSFKVLKK